jgi:hypothetical protein
VGLVVAVLWVMGKGSIKFLHFSFFHNLFWNINTYVKLVGHLLCFKFSKLHLKEKLASCQCKQTLLDDIKTKTPDYYLGYTKKKFNNVKVK